MSDVYTSRLAFWIISTAWMKLRDFPFLGGMFVVWTPFILVAALAAGETLLNVSISVVVSCVSRCRRAPLETPELSSPSTKYQEVDTVEDARRINPELLRQTEAGNGS
jgi:hypothetical protein